MGIWYYVDKVSGLSSKHVVHAAHCESLPETPSRRFLGTFYNANAAILQARKYYPDATGCSVCCSVKVTRNPADRHSVALKHMI